MPSIFQKDCPECAAANKLQALTCTCGYSFDSENTDDADLQQEQLYRDYLAARVVQAEAVLIVAREQVAADPRNAYKGAQALLAEQALNTTRAQLDAHCLRMVKPKNTHEATPVVVAKTAPAKTAEAVKPAASAVIPPAAPFVDNVRPTVSAARMPIKTPSVRPAPKAVPPLASAGAVKPGEVFQRLQATKAQAALRSQQAALKPVPVKVAPTLPTKPTAPTLVSTKSTAPSKQECPNCTAAVAADATGCRCGYAFPTSSHEVPALALDANALAVLNEVLSPTPLRKPR